MDLNEAYAIVLNLAEFNVIVDDDMEDEREEQELAIRLVRKHANENGIYPDEFE